MYIVYLSQISQDKSEKRVVIGKTEDPLHFRLTYETYLEAQAKFLERSGPVKIIYEKVSYES